MKRLISFLLLCLAFCASFADNDVQVVINDGQDNNALRKTMEKNASTLLSVINEAHQNKRLPVLPKNMKQIEQSILMLWDNSPFYCTDEMIVEKCIDKPTGYQIRNIPLLMTPKEPDKYIDDIYQECVIEFDKSGQIESFHLALSNNLYTSLLRGNKDVTDARRRQLIADFVEQLRTAYNTKDSTFLEAIYSDDALIITGRVISERKTVDGGIIPAKIKYNKYNKEQYLKNVKRGFREKDWIKISFDQIEIKHHPNPKKSAYYGVTLHQAYRSSNYNDDGYVFLLWDFRDEKHPKIHVRTWQPDEFNGSKLPKEEIFTIGDFEKLQ